VNYVATADIYVVGHNPTTADTLEPTRPAPARRRGAELAQTILRAAAEELTESGYAGMTMDASLAGLSPTRTRFTGAGPTAQR